MQTLLPTAVNHTATNRRRVTATTRLACYRGATFEDEAQILDSNGDPVRLGLDDVTPWWTFRAQVREGTFQGGGPLVATMTVAILDALAGTVTYTIAPADSKSVLPDVCSFELDVVNVAHPDYDVGFTATPIGGAFHFIGQYAEASS